MNWLAVSSVVPSRCVVAPPVLCPRLCATYKSFTCLKTSLPCLIGNSRRSAVFRLLSFLLLSRMLQPYSPCPLSRCRLPPNMTRDIFHARHPNRQPGRASSCNAVDASISPSFSSFSSSTHPSCPACPSVCLPLGVLSNLVGWSKRPRHLPAAKHSQRACQNEHGKHHHHHRQFAHTTPQPTDMIIARTINPRLISPGAPRLACPPTCLVLIQEPGPSHHSLIGCPGPSKRTSSVPWR